MSSSQIVKTHSFDAIQNRPFDLVHIPHFQLIARSSAEAHSKPLSNHPWLRMGTGGYCKEVEAACGQVTTDIVYTMVYTITICLLISRSGRCLNGCFHHYRSSDY